MRGLAVGCAFAALLPRRVALADRLVWGDAGLCGGRGGCLVGWGKAFF